MVQKTSISVIIPTYNRANLLSRAISSALIQLEEYDELIVIDDGSNDGTKALVSRYGDRIRYIKTENRGAGAARNWGIKEARKSLVAFLDSDDEWMPYKLQIQRAFMDANPDILFSFSNFAFRRRDGNEVRFSLKTWPGVQERWEEMFGDAKLVSSLFTLPKGVHDFKYYVGDIYLPLLTGCYVAANTLVVRRKEAGTALHFAEDTKTYEDWECAGRLAGAGRCAYLDCETAWQNTHFGPRLTDFGGFERSEARVVILERVWGGDKEFIRKHGNLYQTVLDAERLSKISGLIASGRTEEARNEIKLAPNCSLSRRLLSSLPGPIVKPIVGIFGKFKRKFM
jgi:glycosyltransferase involved in cell wall biosynthesis